jgi:PD-(D/E)XK nuclease superfamily protein
MSTFKDHPKRVGDITCAVVLARLLEVFDAVLVPFGENQRYDLVVESKGSFVRVQCKTGRLRNGVIKFPACSINYEHPMPRKGFYARDYRGSADFFGIYCPENDAVYLVPVVNVGRKEGSLRIAPARNNQSERIRWASDYEVTAAGLPHSPDLPSLHVERDSADPTLLNWN